MKKKIKYKIKYKHKLPKVKEEKYKKLAQALGDYLNVNSFIVISDGVTMTKEVV